jgi:hypothetical protein
MPIMNSTHEKAHLPERQGGGLQEGPFLAPYSVENGWHLPRWV